MSRRSLLGLIDNLEAAVKKLRWQPRGTEWHNYYETTNYGPEALSHKKRLVARFLEMINPPPRSVWDLGANTGPFSRIASDKGIQTISLDIDPSSVEKNYRECVKKRESNILPLQLDLTNPSPNLGWANQERMSLLERGPAQTVFALALIHHLVISNNVPLDKVANFFANICDSLIIEYVPKSDSQTQRLLANREDIYSDYTEQTFEKEFTRLFSVVSSEKIMNSQRTLYLMRKRQ